ncbi:MAG: HEAT repeat domain-containing protein [Gemmataceae bacterium]|nr:HEAT repeat domain-containing protein [Gemmataceae bacterium]
MTSKDSPARFSFKIDPNMTLRELLPTSPQLALPTGPLVSDDLRQVPEVAFQAAPPKGIEPRKALEQAAHQIAKINHVNQKKTDAFMETLLSNRTDLVGLPFTLGDACRTKEEARQHFQQALAVVRLAIGGGGGGKFGGGGFSGGGGPTGLGSGGGGRTGASMQPPGGMPMAGPGSPGVVGMSPAAAATGAQFWRNYTSLTQQEDQAATAENRAKRDLIAAARVAALMQVLGPESVEHRRGLAQYLGTLTHVEATRALAKMAIFSAEDEVRQEALRALKVRRERDYTDILLSGLRYPLPAVAKRASDALVTLERADVVPLLVNLLDEPDPRLPAVRKVEGKRVHQVREVVRINHHRNCLLCHAPGNTLDTPQEAVTGAVAIPGEPLPGPSNGYQGNSPDIFVRIDVTYLRQDFSARLPVADAHPWPENQRFDFLVRTRTVSEKEAETYRTNLEPREAGQLSPYRRAVLAALRELTDRDTEPTAPAWRRLLNLPGPRPPRQDMVSR